MISPAGVLSVLPRVQRLKMGPAMAGQSARVWADEVTVHVTVGGQMIKIVPSSLDAEDLAELWMRGAAAAGPLAPCRSTRGSTVSSPGAAGCPVGDHSFG